MIESTSFEERADLDKLVIRTSFSDEAAWWEVVQAIDQPWGGEFDSTSYVVNDSSWENATVERIRQVAQQDSGLSVVFLADADAMTSSEHPLLAVNLDDARNYLDEDYDAEHGTSFGRQFRILPNEASGMQVNLALGNMDYEDWADIAAHSADGVFRGWDS